jgi:hypothetical protein
MVAVGTLATRIIAGVTVPDTPLTVLGQKFCNAKLPKRRTTILGNAVLGR